MTVRTFHRSTEPSKVEDACEEWAHEDLGANIVAAELFDHPSSAFDPRYGEVTGPWVIGPRDEVESYLQERGHEDYTLQVSTGYDPEELPDA